MPSRTRAFALLSVAIAIAIASAGIAEAASSPSKPLTICANKKTGALRTARTCSSKEKTYELGQRGPTGPKGGRGAPGSQGDTGPAGVINARYYANGADVPALPADDAVTTVGSITNLAAGHWFVSASLTAAYQGATGTTAHLDCKLHVVLADQTKDFSFPTESDMIQDIPGGSIESLSTQNAFYPSTASTVQLDCDAGASVHLDNIRIMAVPVSSYK